MRAIEHMTALGLALLLTSMVFVDDPVAKDDAVKDEPKADVVEEPKARSTWEYLADKYDADEDGKITPEEYGRDETHFKRLDVDSDGVIAKAEIEERDRASRDSRGGRGGGRSGGRGGRGGRGEGGRRGPRGEGEERPDRGVAPLEGSEAPDFELLVLAEKKSAKEEGEEKDAEAKEAEEVKEQDASKGEEGEANEEEKEKKLKLSSFKEKERPVALVFGSYT
jgi:hypothetical protein